MREAFALSDPRTNASCALKNWFIEGPRPINTYIYSLTVFYLIHKSHSRAALIKEMKDHNENHRFLIFKVR